MAYFPTVDESPGKMYALAAILMILAILAVILRGYARYLAKASLKWDDFLIGIALLFTLATGMYMH